MLIGKKGLGEVREIQPELAFNKGVDYFTEIVFFYMLMFGIAFYEMDKYARSAQKTKERLENSTKSSENFKSKLDAARTDLSRITTLQQKNRKHVEELEKKIFWLEKELEDKLERLEAKKLSNSLESENLAKE